MIHCAHLACLRNRDRGPSKQLPEIRAIPEEELFNYKFDGSPVLEKLTEGKFVIIKYPSQFIVMYVVFKFY